MFYPRTWGDAGTGGNSGAVREQLSNVHLNGPKLKLFNFWGLIAVRV